MSRAFRTVAAAGLAAVGLLLPLASAVSPAAAATPSVTIVTASTYDVLPAEHRVAVTVEITATSHLRDTVTRHFYSDRAYMAVTPSAAKFHIAAPSGRPSVAVTSRGPAGTVLLLRFGSQLGAGGSLAMTLTFEIPDPGGPPGRPLRISPSLVAFQAWAFGTDGIAGSSVRVRLPSGYGVVIGRGPLVGPTTEADGHLDFDSGLLATPGTFVADVLADRPGDLVESRQTIQVAGESLVLVSQAWPDDPAWRSQVADLLVPGLPALATDIGLGWRLGPELEVRETLPNAAGAGPGAADGGAGDAASLDPGATRLDVAYSADATSILHGAAHAWFNGNLVADRWIADGFAALYAERAGKVIGVAVASPAMTEEALAHAGPLNAWVPGSEADAFGEAAALALARAIAGQAGDPVLQAVWSDAAAGVGAYQPEASATTSAPELAAGPLDWRSLLDLLEVHAGSSFDGLWRRWVVRPADATLLDTRDATRRHYEAVVAAAGAWTLPRGIRDAMRAWQFEAANAELDAATAVLGQRDQVAKAAAGAGLTPPPGLRIAFEGDDGLAAASAEAVTELAVIATYADAASVRPADPGIVTRIGLLGVDPDRDLAAATAAFAAGDLDRTLHLAAAAKATWQVAPEVARQRVLGVLGIGLAGLLLVYLFRSRRRRVRHAHRA